MPLVYYVGIGVCVVCDGLASILCSLWWCCWCWGFVSFQHFASRPITCFFVFVTLWLCDFVTLLLYGGYWHNYFDFSKNTSKAAKGLDRCLLAFQAQKGRDGQARTHADSQASEYATKKSPALLMHNITHSFLHNALLVSILCFYCYLLCFVCALLL